MTESAAIMTDEVPPAAESADRQVRRSLQLYVLLLLIIPFAFLASAVPIVRSPSFPAEAGDPFLLHPDYPYSLKNVACDVLVAGDSTASSGVDPTVIQRTTGLRTCNIAQSQSILRVTGFSALDTYLRNNAPPKFLILQLAPETFAHEREDFFWAEGFTLLFRTRSVAAAIPVVARHPVQAFRFALWAIKAKISALRGVSPGDFTITEESFRSRGGLLMLPKPPQTHCTNVQPFLPPTQSWVQDLRRRYSVNGTRVLIEVSPIPSCAPNSEVIRAGTRDVADNVVAVYPIDLFCDIDRHLTLAGAERWSTDLGRQILTLTQK